MKAKHCPFMFTFLFEHQTTVLSSPSFYHSIHHQLGPLQRPLLSSTSPSNAFRKTPMPDHPSTSSSHERPRTPNQPVYDLVYDPSDLTIRASIPNIPEPGPFSADAAALSQTLHHPPWSRLEALNVHSQFLTTYIDTRSQPLDVERRCKTGRGWWLVWARVPKQRNEATSEPDAHGHDRPREVYLVRKANDTSRRTNSASGLRFFRDLSGVSSSGAGSPAPPAASGSIGRGEKLVMEGLGFDTRKYMETLLSHN